jgi:hypothetical protein
MLLSSTAKLLTGLVRCPAFVLMHETNMAYSEILKMQDQEQNARNAVALAPGCRCSACCIAGAAGHCSCICLCELV